MKLSSFARSLACLAVASAIPAGAHARTCSLPGVHDFDVVVADSSLKEKVADPVRPCAGLYSAPLYRLYNNRELQGRPNHRYTPSLQLASRLEAEGWTLEGVGLCLRP